MDTLISIGPDGKPVIAPWYHGVISRKKSKKILVSPGDYLIRISGTNYGYFVLSYVNCEGCYQHVLIERCNQGGYKVEGDNTILEKISGRVLFTNSCSPYHTYIFCCIDVFRLPQFKDKLKNMITTERQRSPAGGVGYEGNVSSGECAYFKCPLSAVGVTDFSGIIIILIQLSFFVAYKSIVHLMTDHRLFLMFDNDCYARCPKDSISRSNSKTSRVFAVAQPMEKLFLTNTEYFELPKVMRHELDANLLDKAEYLMTQKGHDAALNIIESAIASIDPDINLRNISCAPLVNVKALARAFRLQGNIKEAKIDYQEVSDEMREALACHEMVIIVYDIYMKIITYILSSIIFTELTILGRAIQEMSRGTC